MSRHTPARASALSLLPVVALCVAAMLLAGCGDTGAAAPQSSSTPTKTGSAVPSPSPSPSATSPSASPSAAALPPCAEVWVAGKRLRGPYHGCSPAGPVARADVIGCESGQQLIVFRDRFWAAHGGVIFRTAGVRHDAHFREALRVCRG